MERAEFIACGRAGGRKSSQTLFIDMADGTVLNAGALSQWMRARNHRRRRRVPEGAPVVVGKHSTPDERLRNLFLVSKDPSIGGCGGPAALAMVSTAETERHQ